MTFNISKYQGQVKKTHHQKSAEEIRSEAEKLANPTTAAEHRKYATQLHRVAMLSQKTTDWQAAHDAAKTFFRAAFTANNIEMQGEAVDLEKKAAQRLSLPVVQPVAQPAAQPAAKPKQFKDSDVTLA